MFEQWYRVRDGPLEFMGYRLVGNQYEEGGVNEMGLRWSQELELYLGIVDSKLRYFSGSGELIPTPTEAANQARLESQQALLKAEQAQQRAERLAKQLRALGVEPD